MKAYFYLPFTPVFISTMKPASLLTLIACLFSASCAHQAPIAPPTAAESAAKAKESQYYERYGREWERERREKIVAPPRKGMSREEVRAEYGRPATITSNVRSELWAYSFNGTDARTTSPFHDTSASIRCTMHFDQRTGKLENYTWVASNPILMSRGTGTGYNYGNPARNY